MTRCNGCFALEQRVMDLEAQVRDYKRLLAGAPMLFKLNLTKSESKILQALVEHSPNCMTVEMLYNLLYAWELDPPEPKTVQIFIFKIRKKLAPSSIFIETVWGRGYRLTAENLIALEAFKETKPHG